MSNPRLFLVAVACAALSGVPLAAALVPSRSLVEAGQEPLLKDTDLRKVAQTVREYIESEGSAAAESEVKEEMDKLAKKLEKTPAQGDLLRSPGDLGYSYWLSYDYAKQRTTKGKVEKAEYVYPDAGFGKDSPLEYAVWVPSKYAVKSGPYPLLIMIPDEGQTPEQHLTEDWVDGELRDGLILAAPRMPEDSASWAEQAVPRVMLLMRTMSETYALDFNRIYLGGKGVGLTHAGTIADKFPDRFAGLIGRAGDLGDLGAQNFQNLPSYFAGGGAKVTAFRDSAKELGWDNCTLEPEGKEQDIWNWIQGHSRPAYPQEVVLAPGSPLPRRSAWLEVPPSDYAATARIRARIDRAANTITIDGTGVTDCVVYLNDAMLDLDKPIAVTANGVESQVQVARSHKAFLTNIYSGRSDPGRVFVAAQNFHLADK